MGLSLHRVRGFYNQPFVCFDPPLAYMVKVSVKKNCLQNGHVQNMHRHFTVNNWQ